MKYLALLRGINVGGNNIIKMNDLKETLLANGLQNVVTYIQSGNVIFESDEKDVKKITVKIEKLLSERFNYQARIVLLTHDQLKDILAGVPSSWNKQHDLRCYLAFIKVPMTTDLVLK